MEKVIARHIKTFKENAIDIISEAGLTFKLKEAQKEHRPLKLKIGLDPTSSDIHLGHTVLLKKLRKLQDLGHEVSLIIGDFTAKIGDPSGRNALRPVLSDETIKANASTYTEQAFMILDKNKTTVIYNSQWYKNMSLSDFLGIVSSYTVAQVLQREDFSQRLKENRPLSVLEILYPLIQGYDSVMLKADVEFGGTDQKFNLIVGRYLQQIFGQPGQEIITMPLLVGLDGVCKMSKSVGNYIGVTANAKEMFGKVMSISDDVMWEYFRLLTDYNVSEMQKLHPKEAKLLLAHTIVSFYHSSDAADREKEEFQRVFSQKEIPNDILLYSTPDKNIDIVDTLLKTGMVTSKNEARRLLNQGGVSRVDQQDNSLNIVIKNSILSIPAEGTILKIGKKRFLKIALSH